MPALAYPLLILALYYAGLLLAYVWGLHRLERPDHDNRAAPATRADMSDRPFISVIVPARNEENTIPDCLRALLASTYPTERFEILVVDDGSNDNTAARVRAIKEERKEAEKEATKGATYEAIRDTVDGAQIRLIRLKDNRRHKSGALQAGLEEARGDVIATTDADCTATPQWLAAMCRMLGPETGFVAGPVRYAPTPTILTRLQAMESLGLVAIGAGAVGIGHPHVCNSANIMYRRSAYEYAQGAAAGASHEGAGGAIDSSSAASEQATAAGDDEVLLQRIARDTDFNVSFCADPAAMVTARPEHTLREVLLQRRRWAATGARYPYPSVILTLGGVYLFYLMMLAAAVATFWIPGLWPVVLAALLIKIAGEGAILYRAAQRLNLPAYLHLLVPAQIVQIPYVVLVGLLGPLGTTHWKGRNIQ